uniref:Putative ovule protein n=1 Tax=Solanum chacoense TaxID=4108 RepID=A0A0V0GSS4_SOLCH
MSVGALCARVQVKMSTAYSYIFLAARLWWEIVRWFGSVQMMLDIVKVVMFIWKHCRRTRCTALKLAPAWVVWREKNKRAFEKVKITWYS